MTNDLERQFEVIARTYSLLKLSGYQPTRNLARIGKDMGLADEQVSQIQQRAHYHAKRRGVPQSVDEKGWIWPSRKEALERSSEPVAA